MSEIKDIKSYPNFEELFYANKNPFLLFFLLFSDIQWVRKSIGGRWVLFDFSGHKEWVRVKDHAYFDNWSGVGTKIIKQEKY